MEGEEVQGSQSSGGDLVNRHGELTAKITEFQQERSVIEQHLRSLGIRVPGMTRQRTKATRTRKPRSKPAEQPAGNGAEG